MKLSRRRLLGITGKGILSYLFQDEFITAAPAALTSPRTSEPGPGTIVFADTGNRFSISGGKLILAPSINAEATALSSKSLNLAIGRAAIFKVQRNGIVDFGLNGMSCRLNASDFYVNSAGLIIGATRNDEFICALVLRSAGYWLIDLTNNILLFTGPNTFSNRKLNFGTGGIAPTAFGGSCDFMRVIDMAKPWKSQYGPATSYVASPANGEVISQQANGQIDILWTPASNETIDLQFRRTDDDNCLIIRANQATSTIKLIKREAGNETELASVARTWTASTQYQITALLNGSNIRVMSRATSPTNVGHTSHSNITNTYNQSATGAKVVCTGTIANLVAWPRTITLPRFSLNPSKALYFFALGDSKTSSNLWQPTLLSGLNTATSPAPWETQNNAEAGISLETFASNISTRLANYTLIQDCPHILVNLGINNVTGVGGAVFNETTNKASLQAIINESISRWPTCRIYLTKVWGRGYDTECDTFAGWVDDLIALNPNCRVGVDERIILKGDDNGTTNTSDGIHYSAAGATAIATAWQSIIGY